MEALSAEIARVSAERRRMLKQASAQESRRRTRREHALRVATLAFCHEPTAGATIATATLRKYKNVFEGTIADCTRDIEGRFLTTPVDQLAEWLEWTGDLSKGEVLEAKRLLEDVRLLSWVGDQNYAQGVAPPPQFVWEKRCALSIQTGSTQDERTSSWRPPRSAAAKKWLQRFRRRWGLVLGRRAAKDVLPTDTLRCKADKWVPKNSTPGSQHHSFLGVQNMDPFWGPLVRFS